MRLRSFHAANVAEALQQVRAALGDDAIIVATHDEPNGVRVTAAVDDSAPAPVAAAPIHKAVISDKAPEPTFVDQAAELFYQHGLPSQSAEKLINYIVAQSAIDWRRTLIDALASQLHWEVLNPIDKPIMLLGPTGAGKTLATSKWAVELASQGHKVQLYTTDTARAGGVAQLADLVRWVHIPVIEVETAHALTDGLQMLGRGQVTLIDTAGVNIYDEAERKEILALLKAVEGQVLPVLALPAGGDAQEQAAMAELFSQHGVKHLLTTKWDAARRYGGLLHAAIQHNLTFTHYSAGTRAAAGVPPLTAAQLAAFLQPDLKGNLL